MSVTRVLRGILRKPEPAQENTDQPEKMPFALFFQSEAAKHTAALATHHSTMNQHCPNGKCGSEPAGRPQFGG